MRYRSTIVYLIAGALLISVYIYEIHKERKEEKEKEIAKRILQIEADRVDAISLRKEKETIILKKSGVTDQEEWRIASPLIAETEDFEVNRLKDRLAELKYLRIISENAEDLTQFGLDKPAFTVSFTMSREQGALSFGSKSPIDDGYYARKDDQKRVYLVATNDREDLDRSLFDLRDKRLFTIESDDVNRIVIDRKPEKWVLTKKEGNWVLDGNEDLEIDQQKVAALIRRTVWEEASSFEEENPADLKPYGLDNPNVRITLSDGKKREQILLGGYLKDDLEKRIYAKMSARPQVVSVRKSLLEGLPETGDEIAKKEPEDKEENAITSKN